MTTFSGSQHRAEDEFLILNLNTGGENTVGENGIFGYP